MPALRIAIITDIHHGADNFTKKSSAALTLMEEFRRFVDDAKPDVVIDLGDRISDVDHETDRQLERDVAEAFTPMAAPIFHICGNHDRDYLSVAENEEILGQSLGHEVVALGGWRVVLWRADTRIHWPEGFSLDEPDRLWLAETVRATDRPLAIMSHVPVSGHSQVSNYYFDGNPRLATYPDANRVRDALRAVRVPAIWIAGHVHWNTVTMIDGVPHVTLQSLTESFTTYPEPAAAWGLLQLDENIHWEVFGRDPFRFGIDAATTARRWIAPLDPADDASEIDDLTPAGLEDPGTGT
jgi:Icc protein